MAHSLWIGAFVACGDALVYMLQVFGDIHLLSPEAVLLINSVLGVFIVAAKFYQQNIPATPEQKSDMIHAVMSLPNPEKQ